MKRYSQMVCFAGLTGLFALLGTVDSANAQERPFFTIEPNKDAPIQTTTPLGCSGPITKVLDIAYEGLKTTTAVYGTNPGGGEGGQFDKTPVLTTKVTLAAGACLDAHLSVLVGSKQAYGPDLVSGQLDAPPSSSASHGRALPNSLWSCPDQSGRCAGSGAGRRHVRRKFLSKSRNRAARSTSRRLHA
jgi:hypothetical protein